jgi:hypothetical protein
MDTSSLHWNRRPLQDTVATMKQGDNASYPDISDILARKSEARRERSRRSFGEKIAMVEALRERLAPFKRARERRIAAGQMRALAKGEGG